MNWALPFLFIQLIAHLHSTTESVSILLGGGLVLALVGMSLLLVRSATGRCASFLLSVRTQGNARL